MCSAQAGACIYMLGMDLKPATRFKVVQTYLKPSGRVKSGPDGFKAVGANKYGYKAVRKQAAKPPLPVENDAVHDPSHSDPLQGYKRRQHYNYDASELDFATPRILPAVSRCLEELFPTARKRRGVGDIVSIYE